jgi:molybdopterin converting factor subunit 1
VRTTGVKVQVQLFAGARDRAGSNVLEVELPDDATVADLRRELAQRHQSLGELLSRTLVAVDHEYASDDQTLSAENEIAIIPPVSGG